MVHIAERNKQENSQGALFAAYAAAALAILGWLIFMPASGNLERLTEAKSLTALVELCIVSSIIFITEGLRAAGRIRGRQWGITFAFILLFELYIHRMLLPFVISLIYASILLFLFLWIFGELDSLRGLILGLRDGIASELYSAVYAFPFLLIQLNRMNIAADYDSLRYGLRSRYVLFNGSFFSSLGQINAVYSYPKGLELLLAPMSCFSSFAFSLMLQFWTLLLLAFMIYLLLLRLGGSRRNAVNAAAVLMMLPALGNMSVTAKTDLLTLLFQLLLLYYFIRGECLKGIAAGIFSYSLKPTAIVFTTIMLFMLLLNVVISYAEGRRNLRGESSVPKKNPIRELFAIVGINRLSVRALVLCTGYTALITLRTFIITGVPVSTTFTALFKAVGFRVKWPFNLDAYIDYTGDAGVISGIITVLRRLVLLIFCPVGEDMLHVAIAWGGVWIPVLMAMVLSPIFIRRGKAGSGNNGRRALYLCLIAVSAFSLISLSMLWQVDGNYYILLYSLLLIAAFSGRVELPASVYRLLLLPALITTLITSWAGAVGFTPIDLVNRGYYDNVADIRERERAKGSYELWERLSQDRKTRVLSFSETPEAYTLLCNVQSITDVEGSGGSPGLYDELKYFEWFLSWAETDYVYLQREFMNKPESERNRWLLPELIRDGMLSDAEVAGEYMLFRVRQERLKYVWDEAEKPPMDDNEAEELIRVYEAWLYL